MRLPTIQRCGGCGSRERVSPTTGYCPRCEHQIRREAARHVTAGATRAPRWPPSARRR